MSGDGVCPSCGGYYKGLSLHWKQSDCSYPTLDCRQEDIFTGLLMGDACCSPNVDARLVMTTLEFLKWVSEEFPLITNDVTLDEKGEALMKRNPEMYNNTPQDKHRLGFKPVPDIRRYESWYSTGQKRFPDDLELNPLICKTWYCCDGSLRGGRGVRFSVANESDRKGYIKSLFSDIGFSVTWNGYSVDVPVNESKDFLHWMGTPLPGFEYKWEWANGKLSTDREKKKRRKKLMERFSG